MKKRNLSDACKDCKDNTKSLSWCFDCCGIPHDYLEEIENFRNKSKGDIINATISGKIFK